MNIQLIKGTFDSKDALNLLTKMYEAKIKFHEDKITNSTIEEEIKQRERRIIELQNDLHEIRNNLKHSFSKIHLQSTISWE